MDAIDPVRRPTILIVDTEGEGSPTAHGLRDRYGRSYVVTIMLNADHAQSEIERLAEAGQDLALVLLERSSENAEVLEVARRLHPHARRGFLLNWNESRTNREEIAVSFASRQVECFVTKPVGNPDELFHRSITELLEEWWRIHGVPVSGVEIVGPSRSARIHEIRDVLQRHHFPYTFHPVGSEEAGAVLQKCGVSGDVFPVIVLQSGVTLVNPTNIEIANALGARTRAGTGVYDLVVVGGGPAGLSAAVYAESEGLRTALVEPTAMGGQAGTSSMIRNFFGFPRGISGAELTARAFDQAILFGTEMIYGSAAVGLRADGDLRFVELNDGTQVPGRSVIVATGVSYRALNVASLEPFSGVGVYYGAAMSEAPSLRDGDAVVIGGGNSAGQAAVYLAKFARRVTILVRGRTLAASMSQYLITELDATENIEVLYNSEVVAGQGNGRLERITIMDRQSGKQDEVRADGLFILIGAEPCTAWLPESVNRDAWGYIMTEPSEVEPHRFPYETGMPGVFAVGDVRRDSTKRVASAVGEGAVCVGLVHQYLASMASRAPHISEPTSAADPRATGARPPRGR